jgi:O-antigen ligase
MDRCLDLRGSLGAWRHELELTGKAAVAAEINRVTRKWAFRILARPMSRDVLDKWCERGILGLVLLILVFGPLATGAVRTPDFLVIQALTMGVLLLWVLRLWIKPRPQLLWPPICWFATAFTLYAIGRYLTADIEYVARLEMIRVVVYFFLFLAIINNLHRQEYGHLIILTLIFLAVAISFYAIYQFITGSDKVWTFIKPYKGRGTGTYISPNNLAGFLELLLPSGLAWMLVSRAKAVTKVFVGYASLVIAAGIAVTLSRGSWIATVLVLILFFGLLVTHRMYRLPSVVLLLLILGAGLYFVPRAYFFKARIKQTTANDQFQDSARFDLWRPAVRLWEENIWWGIGPNHYNYRFRTYRPQTEQRQPDRAHNDYLNTLTDWGIVGVLLVGAAWMALYAGVFRTWRHVRGASADLGGGNSNKFAVVLGTSLGLSAMLFHSVVDFNMHIPANAILTISLMAILSSTLRFATDSFWFTVRFPIKVFLTVLLMAGFVYLGWQDVRIGREYVWLQRAISSSNSPALQLEAMQRAFEIEPSNFETAYNIGEVFRQQSWEGNENNEDLATKAMEWYDRSAKLNRFHGYAYMRYGMCLDWLGRFEQAVPYFNQALQLDPNGYFTAAHLGWHYVQTGDYAAARTCFERSKRLQSNDNVIADSYLPLVIRKLEESAQANATSASFAPNP